MIFRKPPPSFLAGLFASGALLDASYTYAAQAESRAEILIKAPIEKVWNLMADVKHWPTWNSAVNSVEMTGATRPGNSFVWKSKGMSITSTLQQVEPMKRLTWTGAAMGTRAFHSWDFEVTDAGVVVRTYENFDGWLPWLLTGMMQKTLDETLPMWLNTLKAAAESGSR